MSIENANNHKFSKNLPRKGKIFIALFNLSTLILVLLFAGCAGVDISRQPFKPVDKEENQQILKKIQKNTNGWNIAKCKIKLSVSTNINGDEDKYNARAVCLWQPDKKIRMRISHILAGTIADILFDGKKWYLTDESNAKIYICDRIDTLRISGFPGSFFLQMQRLPKTWLPANDNSVEIGISDKFYQIKSQNSGEKFEWIFYKNSAFPSEMKIETENNGSLYAAFSKPETNFPPRAGMFKPTLEGYEIQKFE